MSNEIMTITEVDNNAWDQLMQMSAPENSPVSTTVSGVAPVQSWDETVQVLPDIGQVDNKILAAAGKSNTILVSVETKEVLETITVSIGENGNWFVGGLDTGVPASGTNPDYLPKPSGVYSSAALIQVGDIVTIKAGTQYCVKTGVIYGSYYILADTDVTLLADTIILTINGAGVIKQYPIGTNVNLIPESEALIGVALSNSGSVGIFEAPTVHQAWVAASLAKPFSELAQTAATDAAVQAQDAAESAAIATQSKDIAVIEAGKAQASSQAAAVSEANAANSAGNAANSEAGAYAQATAAAASAASAAASAASAAGSASNASTLASQVSADAAQVAADKITVASYVTASSNNATAAATSASNALASENMAEEWAEKPEDSPITGNPSSFSAKHWASKAQQWAAMFGSALIWKGAWSAAAGLAPPTPAVDGGAPFYRISATGTINSVSYETGDYIHWDTIGLVWFKLDGTDSVISVNGKSGSVSLVPSDIGAQPADSTLSAFAGLEGTADQLPYFTSDDVVALTPLSSYNRTLLATNSPSEARGVLGAPASSENVGVADLNTFTDIGIYGVPGTNVNWPWGTNGGTVIVSKVEDYIIQHAYKAADTFNVSAIRTYDVSTGLWSAWQALYNRRNVVGAVGVLGGVPTGAIIESGTNGNGRYIKYADGTLVCTIGKAFGGNAALAEGSFIVLQLAGASVWAWPATFIAIPAISVELFTGNSWAFKVSAEHISAESYGNFHLTNVAVGSVTSQPTVYAIAIGQWY